MIDVQLYIYDLSNGMAKQMSLGFLGKQIDAIYHTSIVMDSLEYVYDGGVKVVPAGKTHLGPPLKTAFLGKTELPMEIILEFLESLKDIYTEEAYDIWTHNCNNFSNDFATFLVGHGIPSYISNLPQAVLRTPFGQMIKPYVDRIARQAQANKSGLLGIEETAKIQPASGNRSKVKFVTSKAEMDNHLQSAAKSCAIIFFTSQNCGPCKALYPLYQKMADDAQEKAVFLIVDIAKNREIGMKYSITATPTFVTFLHGTQENRWTGSDPATLKGNLDILLLLTYPPHPHDSLSLTEFRSADSQPVIFTKVPPMAKLMIKLGSFSENNVVLEILKFISSRASEGSTKLPCPDLHAFSRFIWSAPSKLPLEVLFAVVDLFRVGLADTSFNAYFAKEKDHKTVTLIISHVNSLENCPYSLRLVTLQLCCNLFISDTYQSQVLECTSLYEPILQLVTSSLLDEKNQNVRVAAASLAFNLATANQKARSNKSQDILPEAQQVELAASLLEAIKNEEHSPEAIKGFILALANLIYRAPADGELGDLLKSMASHDIILSKQKSFLNEPLIEEIGKVLLGKGFS